MATPKLIILNGPLGIGKSTLAQLYVDEHPLALKLDIDELCAQIGQWRDQAPESRRLSKDLAEIMTKTYLNSGHDVVIPQIFRQTKWLEALEKVASDTGAEFYEILLDVERDEAIRRFEVRGGVRSGGLIDRGGGIVKVEAMYDEMAETARARPSTKCLIPQFGDIDATYKALMNLL